MKQFFTLVSYLFHPIWLCLIGTTLIFNYHQILHSKLAAISLWRLYGIVALSSIVLPLISGMLLTGIKKLNGLQKANDDQRKIMLLASLVYMSMLAYLFNKAGIQLFLVPFFIGQAVILLAAYLLHTRIRISLHAMGWGGFTSMTIFLLPVANGPFLWFVLLSIFISGIVLTARLWLKAHTKFQIYLGYSVAFILMAITLTYYGYGF